MKSVCLCLVFIQLFIVTQIQAQYDPFAMTGGGGNVALGSPQQNPSMFPNIGLTRPTMLSNLAPTGLQTGLSDPNAVADPMNRQGGILDQQAGSSQPNPQPFAFRNLGGILSSMNYNKPQKKRNQGMNLQQLFFLMMAMDGF